MQPAQRLPRPHPVGLLFLALGTGGSPAWSEPIVLNIDPAATAIRFVLPTTIVDVRGTARLSSGVVRFDPDGGAVSGRFVVDAKSTETGIALRDARMHREVLEVARFPQIVFEVDAIDPLPAASHEAHSLVRGRIAIHGEDHPLAVPTRIRRRGDRIQIDARFSIPYVEWGMKDMETLFLDTSPQVGVEIEARGALQGSAHLPAPAPQLSGSQGVVASPTGLEPLNSKKRQK